MGEKVHEEKLFCRWMTRINSFIFTILLLLLVYRAVTGPSLLEAFVDNTILIIIWLVFLAVTIIFSQLTVRLDDDKIYIGFVGLFEQEISLDNVEDCYPDEGTSFKYLGWGFRVGRYNGNNRLVYNKIGGERLVLKLKEGVYRGNFTEIVFSTENSRKLSWLIEERLGD